MFRGGPRAFQGWSRGGLGASGTKKPEKRSGALWPTDFVQEVPVGQMALSVPAVAPPFPQFQRGRRGRGPKCPTRHPRVKSAQKSKARGDKILRPMTEKGHVELTAAEKQPIWKKILQSVLQPEGKGLHHVTEMAGPLREPRIMSINWQDQARKQAS